MAIDLDSLIQQDIMASYVMEYLHYGTATKKCLDIPEILEMILAQVDMRTLLTSAQRVSRSWFNLISTSSSIQKALFFTPIKDSEWGIKEKILNPLLTEAFPSLFPAKERRYDCFTICKLPMTKDALSMARFIRKDASWRKMLVQQPPISGIGLFPIYSAMGGTSIQCSSIPSDQKMQEYGYDGLRMERLFEVLLLTEYTSPQVYWSTEEPIAFDEGCSQKITDAFYRHLSEFGLVLCTNTVAQCSGRSRRILECPHGADIRDDIMEAYREHDLDVDIKSKNIEESEVEGELVCVSRYE